MTTPRFSGERLGFSILGFLMIVAGPFVVRVGIRAVRDGQLRDRRGRIYRGALARLIGVFLLCMGSVIVATGIGFLLLAITEP